MGQLMDDLLKLSRVTRTDLKTEKLNLSDMAQKIADDLAKDEPEESESQNCSQFDNRW